MSKNNKLTKGAAASLAAILTLTSVSSISASATELNDGRAETENRERITEIALTSYSLPQGAYKINVNINGRDVLQGRVFNLGGVTYVPMFEFADWLGVFEKSYNSYSKTAYVRGKNLEITAKAGNYYISANGRYFYTGGTVMLHNNTLYVPILPLVKALNGYVDWNNAKGKFMVRSGDTSLLAGADRVYNKDDLYWLARIISAEARGEGTKGMIAVGNVVLNRMRSPYFPNTIYGVIFDRNYGIQFTPVANGTIYNAPTEESIIAAKICLEGYSLSSEILYFFNPNLATSNWITNNRQYAFRINNHVFYK